MKLYEIYSHTGIACPVEFNGELEGLLNLIGQSKWLYGNRIDRREAINVDFGNNVFHVNEIDNETEKEWDKKEIVSLQEQQ